jgi:Dolichyl-phosphate-mannose-protein mannosyltransferase
MRVTAHPLVAVFSFLRSYCSPAPDCASARSYSPPPDIDEARYLITAYHLRHGFGYTDWRGPEIDILPLHPLLTAALSSEVETLEWSGRAVTCVASILALAALAIFTLRLGGMRVALIATPIAAFHPWLVRPAGRPDPESLYALLVLMALMGLEHVMTAKPGPRRWGWSGLCFGLAYLTRPEGFVVASFVGSMAAVAGSGTRRERMRGFIRFAAALIFTAAPYLVWLHGAAGHWTLTGKSSKLFFIGQAIEGNGADGTSAEAYLALEQHYGNPLRYVLVHPLAVFDRVGRFGAQLLGSILPRALGPLGVLGWCAALWLWLTRRGPKHLPLWPAAPALPVAVMTLTYPSERVVGSVVIFLLIPAAFGLSELWDQLRANAWPEGLLASSALILVATQWSPSIARAVGTGRLDPLRIERDLARRALALENDVTLIANNSPVVSFYLRDPRLFGPPGHYEPLPLAFECAALVEAMTARGTRVAILDQWAVDRAPTALGPECPVRLVETMFDPDSRRRLDLVAFPSEPR